MPPRWLIFCFVPLVFPALARAEAPQPNRVLKSIDFEERQLGNNEDLPMHWTKITGKGLPHYVNGCLATDRAHGGQYSFRFDLNGGSVIYRYDPTQIPVLAGARYRVECYCQTTVLADARARMTTYFTDLDGHPLSDTVANSQPYAAQTGADGWTKLTIELNADNPKAAYLAVELGLLQPQFYAPATLGDRTLWPQDIQGSAWFDDLVVAQVPQVTLGTDRPGNIFRLGDVPRMSVLVNDLFTDDLQSQLTLVDGAGALIYQRSGAMDMAGAVQLGLTRKRMTIALPPLPTGWYRATLQLTSHGRNLGQQTATLIQLADAADPIRPDTRFGVIATDLALPQMQQLPLILPLLSAGRVKIAVWSDQQDTQENDPVGFDALLEALQTQGITTTGCLTALPPALARSLGGPSWLRLLQASADAWQPQVAYLVSRNAHHLDHWQIGTDGSDAFVADDRMRQVYRLVFDQFARLMRRPDLAMPWPAWYDLNSNLPATVALSIPPQVLPEQIPLYISDLRRGPAGARSNSSVSLQFLAEEYGRGVRLRDAAQRVLYALAAGANRIDLPLPFSAPPDNPAPQTFNAPQEMFLLDRTIMRMLTGATYKGKAKLADGVEALLFDKEGQGILALWSRPGAGQSRPLSLNLGAHPLKVDLWGSVTPLPHINGQGAGPQDVQVDVGPMPFYIVGVDATSAQLRANIAFDQPLLESSFQAHARRLIFTNPGNTLLTGSLRLRPPPGWTMTPASFQFSIKPGKNFDQTVTIEFPYNSVAGDKTVVADFNLDGDGGSEFAVPLTLTLGLSDVGMQSLALRDGSDLLIQEMISNYGERPIDYTAYAAYPGLTRQERLISGLEPGHSVVKLYRFKNVKFIPGAQVRCGLRQFEGTRVLNDEVAIQ